MWDESKANFIFTRKGSQSVLILLYGVTTILLTILMILVWRGALKSAYKAECLQKKGMHVNTFAEDLKSLLHENLYRFVYDTTDSIHLCIYCTSVGIHDLYGVY